MAAQLTSDDVRAIFEQVKNWGRWGADDQLGTINLITAAKRRQAAALVAEGTTVSCSRVIRDQPAVDVIDRPLHHMTYSGECWALHPDDVASPSGIQLSRDFIGMMYHGNYITHLDALCHIFWKGKMYNGLSAELVTTARGALAESVELVDQGIVSRGVLLDVAAHRGVPWLELGTPIGPDELEEVERAQGVQVEEGDILLVRTGFWGHRESVGPVTRDKGLPGLHAACLPWLRDRGVAVLCGDTMNDVVPSGYTSFVLPLHEVGQVAMGLWLVDNCSLEDLSAACAQLRRWAFLVTLAPLRIEGGTGSPLNPIVMF
jgi:kynurenine formamidase